MKLSELMSSLGLWVFPVVGLLGFVAAFAAVAVRVGRAPRAEMARNRDLPFIDGSVDEQQGVRP